MLKRLKSRVCPILQFGAYAEGATPAQRADWENRVGWREIKIKAWLDTRLRRHLNGDDDRNQKPTPVLEAGILLFAGQMVIAGELSSHPLVLFGDRQHLAFGGLVDNLLGLIPRFLRPQFPMLGVV